MGRHYDEDIECNSYLNEHGKYALQFARNHNISIQEAYEHPAVKAHKETMTNLAKLLFASNLVNDALAKEDSKHG